MPPWILLSCRAMWSQKKAKVFSLHEISQSYQLARVRAGWILTIPCCANHTVSWQQFRKSFLPDRCWQFLQPHGTSTSHSTTDAIPDQACGCGSVPSALLGGLKPDEWKCSSRSAVMSLNLFCPGCERSCKISTRPRGGIQSHQGYYHLFAQPAWARWVALLQ